MCMVFDRLYCGPSALVIHRMMEQGGELLSVWKGIFFLVGRMLLLKGGCEGMQTRYPLWTWYGPGPLHDS